MPIKLPARSLARTLFFASSIVAAAEKPNIVLVFTDDMGFNDIGAFTYPAPPNHYPNSGPEPEPMVDGPVPDPNHARTITPQIDKLARDGLMMTQFYANTICSPSRAALLTGRYSHRVGVNEVFRPSGQTVNGLKGLNTTEVTLPAMLRELGYATGIVGKWHLGYRPNVHSPFQMMPTRQGFEEFYGHPHSNDMGSYAFIRNETILDPNFSPAEKQAETTWRYTEESLAFIERQHDAGRPFFLYLPHIMTHIPCWPSDRELTNADGTIWPKFLGSSGVSHYYDVVKEIDHSIGRLLEKLDELQIAENTIVIFTSDNGPWLRLSNKNLKERSVGSAYPLRSGKGTTFEGGVRVPFLVRWPGQIPPGTVLDEQLSGVVDMLPTLVKLAGGAPPSDRVIDGIDLWPVWSGASATISRTYAHFVSNTGALDAVVKDRWKLRSNQLFDVWDLEDQETTNHAPAHPEVMAELQTVWDSIADSLAAESVPLGEFTDYEVLVPPENLLIQPGETATFEVSLSANPGKDVTVTVSRFSGNTDLSVSTGENLSFNSTNWNIPQEVTLSAAPGSEPREEGATFRVSTDDIEQVREVFAFVSNPLVEVSLVWPKVDRIVTESPPVKIVAEAEALFDDEMNPLGISFSWSRVSGPGEITFTHPGESRTGVSFSAEGLYRLRLIAGHPDAGGPGLAEFLVDVGGTGNSWIYDLLFSPAIVYDASVDRDGDSTWRNLISPGSWDITFSSGVIPNLLDEATQSEIIDPAPSLSFIESAVHFPGGNTMEGGVGASLQPFSADDASFEFWFKPEILPVSVKEVLWETGGNIGASFILENTTLMFIVTDGAPNGAIASGDLQPDPDQDGFIHAVGVIDLEQAQIRLFIDGELADTKAIPNVSSWCGTSGTGFGKIDNADVGTDGSSVFGFLGGNQQISQPVRAYAGLIAMARMYPQALSEANVAQLHADPRGTKQLLATAPGVSAGESQSVAYTAGANLSGEVSGDQLFINTQWRGIEGPGTVSFQDASQPETTTTFDLPGTYELWLEADDGVAKAYDDTEITVAALTYAEWAEEIELPENEAGPGDKLDNSRFPNAWNWILGYDFPGADDEQPGLVFDTELNATYLRMSLSFDVPRNRDPDIIFQYSSSLETWETVVDPYLIIEPVSDTHAHWIFHLDVPASESIRFLRAAVVIP